MERQRKDYGQMRRALQGQEPASAAVVILRAGSAAPTEAARRAAGWALAAQVAAAAAQAQLAGTLPSVLRLFAVHADGLYPAAPQLEDVAAHATAALTHPLIEVQPLPGSYGGGDSSVGEGVECRSGGKAGFQLTWEHEQRRYTVRLEASLSRIALAGACQPAEAVEVVSMTVQSAKKDGQLEVTVQLASALPGAGTRLPVAFAGFGLPGWDQRKSKSITKDRCTLTFDGPASQQQQLEALGAELAAGTRKATAAVAGAACSSTAAEGSATRTQALLLELQPQAAELRTEPEQIDSAAATAVKQSLWTWLGSLGRQLVPLLLAANNAPVSLDARLQRLEAKTETVGTQADVLADHVDSQFSGLASALCEQQGSISHLEERVRLLEVSAGRSSQQTAATADAGQPPDVEMAAADSRKRSRLTGASEAEAQALPPLAPAAAQQQQQQQQQQRGGSTPLGSDASVLHTCGAVAAVQGALMRHHIAHAAAEQHQSCSHEQLLQASLSAGHPQLVTGAAGGPSSSAAQLDAAAGSAAGQPGGHDSALVVPHAPAHMPSSAGCIVNGISAVPFSNGVGSAALVATAGTGSVGAAAAQPATAARGPPGGQAAVLQPTSVLQLQPPQLASMVFHVLKQQWQQGRCVSARELCSLVCRCSREALPSLMLLEDPAMPAEQKSLITRHITTLAYNLSCRPGSWVVRWQQGETAYYSLAHSWATGAAAVAAAAAAPAAAVGQ